jgi:hypothetical protein
MKVAASVPASRGERSVLMPWCVITGVTARPVPKLKRRIRAMHGRACNLTYFLNLQAESGDGNVLSEIRLLPPNLK